LDDLLPRPVRCPLTGCTQQQSLIQLLTFAAGTTMFPTFWRVSAEIFLCFGHTFNTLSNYVCVR
jgi:hypothetical protein